MPVTPSAPSGREGDLPTQPGLFPEPRAHPPRAPAPSPAMLAAQADQAAYLHQRESKERRSVLRGLILLALVVLLISLVRAGFDRAFFTGWWRQW